MSRISLGFAASVAAVAAATGLIYPLKEIAPAVSLGVVYIPGVLLVAAAWGLPLGLFTSLLSAAAFNYFHLPPIGALDVAADHDLVALFVFVIVAVAGATLAELARARAQMKVGLLTALETPGGRIERIARQLLAWGRLIPSEEIVRKVDAVTVEEAREAGRVLLEGAPTVAAVGPLKGLPSLSRLAAGLRG